MFVAHFRMQWSTALTLTVLALLAGAECRELGSRRLLASNLSVVATLPIGMPPLSSHLPSTLAPMVLNSCTYSPLDGKCTATNNLLLKKGSIPNWSKIPFGGRAHAFYVAGTAYCGRLALDSPNCTYPCASDGVRCGLTPALVLGNYACPGSKAIQDAWCTLVPDSAPENPKKRCSSSPFCKQQGGEGGQCLARFKAGLNSNEIGQYYYEFATTRRNVWGCCEGSQAVWMENIHCDRFNSQPDRCISEQGCQFNDDGTCAWVPEAWLGRNFGAGKTTNSLSALDKECSAIKSEAKCNQLGPVSVDGETILQILKFKLSSINKPVKDDMCLVWASGDVE